MLSGFKVSLGEMKHLQHEFNTIDKDRSGTITKDEIMGLANADLPYMQDLDWQTIIQLCDANGDGVIDF